MMRADPLSLGEGETPVLELRTLARRLGIPEFWIKAEWLNPTGSYKDRIAVETIRDAVRRGSRGWIGTSSGNGGAAMSAYAARAGLPGFLCVAADAPREKLQSIVPYGMTMLPMVSIGVREMDEIAALAHEYELKLAVTAYRYNPEGMSGAEAIGAELVREGPFSHVYVPTGGGGLLVAVARGLDPSSSDGPTMVCVQPRGCGPVARHLEGEIGTPEIGTCTTTISGLQLPTPPDGVLATAAVRHSGGWGCLVSDDEAWDTQATLAEIEGVFVEPASALAVSAIVQDFRSGRLTKDDRPIAILTGSGLKDLRRFSPDTSHSQSPVLVDDLRGLLADTFADHQDGLPATARIDGPVG
jgi:threonine synthase